MDQTGKVRGMTRVRQDIDIERLVTWTYRDQKADQAEHMGLTQDEVWARRLGGGDRTALASDVAILGCRVDTSPFATGRLHPDAEAVHAEVLKLSRLACGLVIEFGRTGGRPDWFEGARVVERYARKPNGYPIRCYDAKRNFIGYKRETVVLVTERDVLTGAPVEVDAGIGPEGLETARIVWEAWAGALVLLAGALRAGGALVSHRVTGPTLSARPWEGDAVAVPLPA